MTKINKWDRFIKEVSNLIFFWFFSIVFFTLFRITFITLFRHQIGDKAMWNDFISVLFTGFRFDCTGVVYFLFVPLLFVLILAPFGKVNIARKIRIVCQYLFVILSTLICIVTINYYKEFNDQFNNFLFLFLYDDKAAVAQSILEYYNPVVNTLIFVVVVMGSVLVLRYFEKKEFIYSWLKKIKFTKVNMSIFIFILLALAVSSARGTFGINPTTRRWAATSKDPFLNKTVINPYRSLKYAYADYESISSIEKDNPYGEIDLVEKYKEERISDIIVKKAKGTTLEKPKHVFMIIMESYDCWPLMDKYLDFEVGTNLHRIATNGTYFNHIVPSYHSTQYAFASIVSGIPCFGLNTSMMTKPDSPSISSIFTHFKRLGYKTNMFYGGYLSWENIGNFTEHQGCENIYSGAEIDDVIQTGDWAVKDESLFNKILETVGPDEYTFNLILTSSYHTPYTVDIYKEGFPYHTKEDIPETVRDLFDNGMSMKQFGHQWYGDIALGKFMDQAEPKYGNALYAFTGDHFSRKFVNGTPNLYEAIAVPFVLYGQGIESQKLDTPGGHADIMPTLIELVAPKGFEYHSFGQSMFDDDKKLGVGCEMAVDGKTLFVNTKDSRTKTIDLSTFEETTVDTFEHQKEYDDIMRLSWHYIARGDSLKKK